MDNYFFPSPLPKRATVDIVIITDDYFTILGKREGQFVISEDEEGTLLFKLKAKLKGRDTIRIIAYYEGNEIARVTLFSAIEDHSSDNIIQQSEQNLKLISMEQTPDLSLLIQEHEFQGEPAITFIVHAKDSSIGLNHKIYDSFTLKTDPLLHFQYFFKDIENMEINSETKQRMAKKGSHLFDALFPTELQKIIWQHKDRICSVKIESTEAWIPWELCLLHGQDNNGKIIEAGYFCEMFEITRWIPGIARYPQLTMNNMAFIMPMDTGLPNAVDEKRYMLSLANKHRQVESITAQYTEVCSALASSRYDAFHFTGHGMFSALDPNRSGFTLENNSTFTAEDISGEMKNLGSTHHPVIFLNACQAGRGAFSLTGIGGFASQFLHAGAGAFIGAYWNIYDESAYKFSNAFYERILAGKSIGKATKEARLQIKKSGDLTWLAYTIYADPAAEIIIDDEIV